MAYGIFYNWFRGGHSFFNVIAILLFLMLNLRSANADTTPSVAILKSDWGFRYANNDRRNLANALSPGATGLKGERIIFRMVLHKSADFPDDRSRRFKVTLQWLEGESVNIGGAVQVQYTPIKDDPIFSLSVNEKLFNSSAFRIPVHKDATKYYSNLAVKITITEFDYKNRKACEQVLTIDQFNPFEAIVME